MTTIEAPDVEQVRMRKIKEQEAHVRELEVAYKTQQEATKEARQELSDAIYLLRRLIRGEVEDQQEFDFDGHGEPSDEDWNKLLSSTRLEDAITLTKSQRQKFEDLGVFTVRHFEQLRAGELPGFSGSLSDVKGITYVAYGKLEEAILDWFDRRKAELAAASKPEVSIKGSGQLADEVANELTKAGVKFERNATVGGRRRK